MSIVVDQRDIQSRGGRAAIYPSSYIVYSILNKHNLYNNVLDVTYGRGRFYAYKRPRFLVGADPKVWEWVVVPDIFIPKPVWALKDIVGRLGIKFDVVVCDPPQWNKDVVYNKRDEYSYVLGSTDMIIEYSFRLAKDIGVKYVLLHYKDTLNYEVVEDVIFKYFARYLHNENKNATHFTLYKVV